MGRFDKLYARLPVWGQNAAVSAYGAYWKRLRFGPGYREHVAAYVAREQFDEAQWREWTKTRLRQVLSVAAEHVPYYRDHWTAAEKKAARDGSLEELPFLEKDPVRSQPRSFLRTDMQVRRPHVFHTSGSTGTPIASIWTTDELRQSMAVREVRSARWAGVSFELPRATFSGRMVVPDANSAGPYYRFNRMERQAYLSAFHLRAETAPQYVEALRRHHIQWLTGYAVSYYLLAEYIVEQKLPVPALKALITTSEKVTPQMREVLERAYGCRTFEEYSTVENLLFASECSHGRLHVSPEVGLIEILRPDGTPCDAEEVGEVVTTGLLRDYQPMIRFRLGDLAAWDSRPCPCGRVLPVIKEVVGRIEDVVVGPDGRRLVRFHGIFVDQPHVREGQIIQEAIDRIRVKVVPAAGYGSADEQDIVRRIQQRLTAEMQVIVEVVESIPRTKAGKFQAVVSLLKHETSSAVPDAVH
jgi:phenylacetate-CoA ligase